jgi:hypothetical protein
LVAFSLGLGVHCKPIHSFIRRAAALGRFDINPEVAEEFRGVAVQAYLTASFAGGSVRAAGARTAGHSGRVDEVVRGLWHGAAAGPQQ